jgi:hypothetical protein
MKKYNQYAEICKNNIKHTLLNLPQHVQDRKWEIEVTKDDKGILIMKKYITAMVFHGRNPMKKTLRQKHIPISTTTKQCQTASIPARYHGRHVCVGQLHNLAAGPKFKTETCFDVISWQVF